MNLQDTTITSDRLLLVPIAKSYAEEIFKEFTPEITRFMYPKPPEKIEETLAYITEANEKMQKGQDLAVTILHKDTKEFIGGGGIHDIETGTPELGIWIKKSAHGNKYGQEAVSALFTWAKENLEFDHFLYPVAKENIGSRKIAQSLGGKVVREMQETNLSGVILDMVEYKIEKPIS